MSGILFLNTQDLDRIRKFYQAKIGMTLWLDQGDCVILKHGNLMIGFCKGEEKHFGGLITFFYETKQEVDEIFQVFNLNAEGSPQLNEKFKIYHFYALDPEGRRLEFQYFLHPSEPFLTGEELLLCEQRVQRFKQQAVPKDVLRRIFSLCRYPSSTHESPIYTFSIVQDQGKKNQLMDFFGTMSESIRTVPSIVVLSSEKIANASMLEQVLIGTYHFSLAARLHGLGTDIVKAMDQEGVKRLLNLPQEDHVILAFILGYPDEDGWVLKEEMVSNKIRFVD
jgi:nitroreductase/catechol 2,3-dioxygenase-like lactoylglutathione lyase family enzyme